MITQKEIDKRMPLFMDHVDVDMDTECWIWTGNCNEYRKPRFAFFHDNGRQGSWAQKFIWMAEGFTCNPKKVLTAVCGTANCVNIDHLVELTGKQYKTWTVVSGSHALEGLTHHRLETIREMRDKGQSFNHIGLLNGYSGHMIKRILEEGEWFLDVKQQGRTAVYA